MKTAIALIIPFFLAAHALTQERIVDSRIDAVTIFPSRAEITRVFSVDLPAGTHHLRLKALETGVVQPTIRAQAADTAVLVRYVKYEINYLESRERGREVAFLEDSLRMLTEARTWMEHQLEVLDGEEALLTDNRKADNLDPEKLRQRLVFYQQELTRIRRERMAITAQMKETGKTINRLNLQISQLQTREESKTGEITLHLEVSRPVNASFELSYAVPHAEWTPQYDVFARSEAPELHIFYKASIRQTTGYDWTEVKVTLVSADPYGSPVPTRLEPVYTRFLNYGMDTVLVFDPETYEEQYQLVSNEIMPEWLESPMAHRFEIPGRISIAHDKPYDIAFREAQLPAEWEMICIPKLSPEVGVYAALAGLHEQSFLPGEARLYLDRAYLRTEQFNPYSGGDTLRLYFGKNQSIAVERQTTDFRKDSRLSGQTRLQIGMRLQLHNAGKLPARIRLLDQVPLSADKSIAIQLLDSGKAAHTPAEGLLTWMLELAPGQTQERVFSYQIRCPAGREVMKVW